VVDAFVAALDLAELGFDGRWRRSVRDSVDKHVREESLFAALARLLHGHSVAKMDLQKVRPRHYF
jgi:hypothetical protein